MNNKLQTLRVIAVTTVAMVASSAIAATDQAVTVTPEFITRLAEEMRTNNPALLAADQRTNSAAASVKAVRTWEDPMLIVGGMGANKSMRSDNGDVIYGVEQKLPLFGKPAAARRVARAEFEVESLGAEYEFQSRRAELAKAVFRAALAEQVVSIGEQDLLWLKSMLETIEGRYRAGGASLVDLLQIQNEESRRVTRLQTDRDDLAHQRLGLNRMLNRDLESAWPALLLPTVAAPVPYNQSLVRLATSYEPKLLVMRQQIKQAHATLDATRRERWPEVSLGVENRNYSGDGDWVQTEVSLNFSLPLFNKNKYRANIHRDEAKARAVEFDAADYELSLHEEIHLLTVRIDAARREALTYRDQIIPRSEQALTSTKASWESSGGTLRELLDSRRMVLDGRLMYARAVSEQYQMLSELVLCCGLGDLEALQMLGITAENQNKEANP